MRGEWGQGRITRAALPARGSFCFGKIVSFSLSSPCALAVPLLGIYHREMFTQLHKGTWPIWADHPGTMCVPHWKSGEINKIGWKYHGAAAKSRPLDVYRDTWLDLKN